MDKVEKLSSIAGKKVATAARGLQLKNMRF
jgi:hypothetical protein